MDDNTRNTGVQDTPDQAAQPVSDTASSQDTSADVQVINEAPEATQEVKEPVEKAEDTASEQRLYAGKYKTVEDMERAYSELNSKATKDAQEKAELTRVLNEAFATPEPQAQAQQEDYYSDTPDPVAQKIDSLERSQVVQGFIFSHPDANAETMQKVLTEDPVVKSIPDYNAKLQYAYAMSKNMASQTAIEEAKKQAAAATQAKIVEKQAAQVEQANKQAQTVEDNKELSKDELRKRLQDGNSFDDLIKERFPGISKMRASL